MFGRFGGGQRGGARRQATGRGADLRTMVEIGLEEAFAGTKKTVRVPSRVSCEACSGTGAEAGSAAAQTCPTCQGAGKVRAQQGFFLIERTCPTCSGAGRIIKNPCKVCQGAGTRAARPHPASRDPGRASRTAPASAWPARARPGCAARRRATSMSTFSIKAHPIFQRDGANIFVRVPLRMTQAALGGEVEVPAIDGGRSRVKIPAGTQTGDQFRLRGKGFSVLRSTARGDMFVQVSVETPQNLTAAAARAAGGVRGRGGKGGRTSPESEGFFAKVAAFWDGLAR